MVADVELVSIPPVAGIPIVHELSDGIALERRDAVPWSGTFAAAAPIVIRHRRGDPRPAAMRPVLAVPPWCTFQLDGRGEPASLFHAVFGEVDRLLSCEVPGSEYVVRYGAQPREPVIALQSELTTFSFALAARGLGLIAHSCAFITRDGDGVMCPGVSGTGKTTLARLLMEQVAPPEVLTDDRAIITLDGAALTVWGSPWPGAARVAAPGSAQLTTVVFITHGSTRALRPVKASDAFRRIINMLSMPLWEPARCGRALEIVDAIVSRTRLIEATYPPAGDAARWLLAELGAGASGRDG